MNISGTKMMTMVIGIDPGINGGIASYCANVHWVEAIPMPILQDEQKKYFLGLNVKAIREWIEPIGLLWEATIVCYIEQVHSMPQQGVSSTFKFGRVYGEIIGIMETLGIPIYFVTPQAWKKEILGTCYPHDKKGAIDYQVDIGNGIKILRPGGRASHDGMADALCIAEYGWRKVYNKKEWIL